MQHSPAFTSRFTGSGTFYSEQLINAGDVNVNDAVGAGYGRSWMMADGSFGDNGFYSIKSGKIPRPGGRTLSMP
jgi:hypothetical protein